MESNKLIEKMVRLVQRGHSPQKVWESSLSLHPGSMAQVNKSTTAKAFQGNESVSVSKGTNVTVVGVGGGESGVDHHVQLPDGKHVVIPFSDLSSAPTA